MALHCNECRVEGKSRKIICNYTGEPCFFMRYCAVSSKYYQTDAAKRCRRKEKKNE